MTGLFRSRPPLPLDLTARNTKSQTGRVEMSRATIGRILGEAGGWLFRRGAKNKAKRGTSYFLSSTHDGHAFVIHFCAVKFARNKARSLRLVEM